jgi:hypothetical protein
MRCDRPGHHRPHARRREDEVGPAEPPSIRVAMAALLLRRNVEPGRIVDRTGVPWALVEFLSEHGTEDPRPARDAGPSADLVHDPARPWATVVLTPDQAGTATRALGWLGSTSLVLLALLSGLENLPALAVLCGTIAVSAVVLLALAEAGRNRD